MCPLDNCFPNPDGVMRSCSNLGVFAHVLFLVCGRGHYYGVTEISVATVLQITLPFSSLILNYVSLISFTLNITSLISL